MRSQYENEKLLPIAVAAALLGGGSISSRGNAAEPAPQPYHQRRQWLERAKELLGLTDEQVQKIKAELGTEKDTLKDFIANLRDARVGPARKI